MIKESNKTNDEALKRMTANNLTVIWKVGEMWYSDKKNAEFASKRIEKPIEEFKK